MKREQKVKMRTSDAKEGPDEESDYRNSRTHIVRIPKSLEMRSVEVTLLWSPHSGGPTCHSTENGTVKEIVPRILQWW